MISYPLAPTLHPHIMGKLQSKPQFDMLEDLRSVTQFNAEEIIEWHKGFKNINNGHSWLLTMEEFKRMYGNFFPFGDACEFSEHVFRAFDTNSDGSIDFREFVCALSITSKGQIEDKLEWAFNMYDLDRDGFITRAEMLEMVTSIYKMEGAGKMSEDEATPEKRMRNFYRKMDGDTDGRLSLEEFLEGARNDPTVCNLFTYETFIGITQ